MKKIFLFVFILISFLSFVISDDQRYNEEELIELLIDSDFSSNEIKNLIRDLTPHDLNRLSEENVQRVSEDVAKLYFENKLPKKIDNSNELILFEKMTGTKLLNYENLKDRGAEFEIKEEGGGFIFEQKISGSIVSVLINDQISEIKLTELGIEIGDILFKQGEFYNFNFNNNDLEFESNSLFEIEFDNSRLVGDLKGNNEKFFFGEQHANVGEYYFYQTEDELSIKSNRGFHDLYLDENFDLELNFVVNDDARINVYGDDINEPLIFIDKNFNSKITSVPWNMGVEVGGKSFLMSMVNHNSVLQIKLEMNNEEDIKNHFSRLAELQKKINQKEFTTEDVRNRDIILNELRLLGVEPHSIIPSVYRNYEEYWLALSLGEENLIINQAMISTRSETEISQINHQNDRIAQLYRELAELQKKINQGDLSLESERDKLIDELMRIGQKNVYHKGDNNDLTYDQLWKLRSEQFSNGDFELRSELEISENQLEFWIREQLVKNKGIMNSETVQRVSGTQDNLCAAYVKEVLTFYYDEDALSVLAGAHAWDFDKRLNVAFVVNDDINVVLNNANPGDVLAIHNVNSRYNDRGDFTHVATYLGDGLVSHLIGDDQRIETLEDFNNKYGSFTIKSILTMPEQYANNRNTNVPYTINPGETLYGIIKEIDPNVRYGSNAYNEYVEQIKEINNLNDPNLIRSGEMIFLPEKILEVVGEVMYADIDTSSRYINPNTFQIPSQINLRDGEIQREVPDEIRSAIESISEGDPLMEATLINIWIQETQYGGNRELMEQLVMNPDFFNQEVPGTVSYPISGISTVPLANLLMRGVSDVKERILEYYDYDLSLPGIGRVTANSYGITQVNLDLVVRMYDEIDSRTEAIHFLNNPENAFDASKRILDDSRIQIERKANYFSQPLTDDELYLSSLISYNAGFGAALSSGDIELMNQVAKTLNVQPINNDAFFGDQTKELAQQILDNLNLDSERTKSLQRDINNYFGRGGNPNLRYQSEFYNVLVEEHKKNNDRLPLVLDEEIVNSETSVGAPMNYALNSWTRLIDQMQR